MTARGRARQLIASAHYGAAAEGAAPVFCGGIESEITELRIIKSTADQVLDRHIRKATARRAAVIPTSFYMDFSIPRDSPAKPGSTFLKMYMMSSGAIFLNTESRW
jgi:hypothetical protein